MTAALRQTSNFIQRFGKRFQEARQARANQVIDEYLRYYSNRDALRQSASL